MNHKTLTRLLIVGLVIVLLGSGFAGQDTANAQAAETLTLALVTSSAESDTAASRHFEQGVRLAVELLNAAGGVRGPTRTERYTFTLKVRSASTGSEMRSAIQASIEDQPVAIIGPNSPTLANNNLDLATTNRIPQLVSLNINPTGTAGNFVFRMRANDDLLARDLGDYLVRQRYYTTIATAADDSARGTADRDAFNRAVRAANVTPNPVVNYDDAATDLSAQAGTILDAETEPEVVAIFGVPGPAAALAAALRDRGYEGEIVYGSMQGNAEAFTARGGERVRDVYGALLWWPGAGDTGSLRFAAEYQRRYGEAPDANAAIGFDSVAAIAGAVKLTGKAPADIRNTLAAPNRIGGVQGVYSPVDNRLIESSLIVQVGPEGVLTEAARYNVGRCQRGCGDTNWPQNSTVNAVGSRTVTLAFVGPQTGTNGEAGRKALQGAQLAVNEINTAGGILGPQNIRYTLDIRRYDATTAQETGEAIRAALTAGSSAILGPTLAGSTLPNIGLATAARVPQFVSGTADALITADPSRFILPLRPSETEMATALARYLIDTRGYTRFALASATTRYGEDSVAAFNTVLRLYQASTDARVVATNTHDVMRTDFTAVGASLAAASPEVVIAWTTPTAAAALLKSLTDAGFKGLFAYGAISSPDFLAVLPSDLPVNVIGTATWTAESGDRTSDAFAVNYTLYGETPNAESAAYYDAVYMIAAAIRANGPLPAQIQSYVAGLGQFAGVQGVYTPATSPSLSRTVQILGALPGEDGISLRTISTWDAGVCVNNCY